MAHGAMAALTENDPEKISNMQKTNQRTANETRKKGLKRYAAMTIFTIEPARLMPKMGHHKLPTTIVTSLTLRYVFLPSVTKMYAAYSRLPHNVLHSPSFTFCTVLKCHMMMSI